MNIKDISESKTFRGVLMGISGLVICFVIFQTGVVVGEHKALFAHGLGDNFERNFRDPRAGGFMQRGIPLGSDIPGGHGAVGEIVNISLPLIIVAGPDNLEKTIVVKDSTEIRKFRDTIQSNELTVGDFIVVLGTPNDKGQIDAKLIRLAPPPPPDFNEKKPNP